MTLIPDSTLLRMIKSVGGVSATLQNGSLYGVFDREFRATQMGDIEIEDRYPIFECRSSDVETLSIIKDVTLTIEGTDFRVNRLEPDGNGMTILVLKA